jgi:20S proteasome subunit alpha 6
MYDGTVDPFSMIDTQRIQEIIDSMEAADEAPPADAPMQEEGGDAAPADAPAADAPAPMDI